MKFPSLIVTAVVFLAAAAAPGQVNLIGNGTFDDPLIPDGPSSPGNFTVFQGDFGGGGALLLATGAPAVDFLVLGLSSGVNAFIGVQQQVLGLNEGDRIDLSFELSTLVASQFITAFEFRFELIDAAGDPIDFDNDGSITFGPGDILAFNNTLIMDQVTGELLLDAADAQGLGTGGRVTVTTDDVVGPFLPRTSQVRIEGFEIPAGIGASGVNVVFAVQSFFVQPAPGEIVTDVAVDNVVVSFGAPGPVASLSENFNVGLPRSSNGDAATGVFLDLPSGPWFSINESANVSQIQTIFGSTRSNPSSSPGPPGPFEGDDAAYNRVSTVTVVPGDHSIYLMTPEVELVRGAVLRFRTASSAIFAKPNRLRVRLSTSGPSVETADFTDVLLTINESLSPGGYPTGYQQFTVTVPDDVPRFSTGRFAFHVDQPITAGASPIAIDTVTYNPPPGLAALNEGFDPAGFPLAAASAGPPGVVYIADSGDWVVLNNSQPIGVRSIGLGNAGVFESFSGEDNHYAVFNFENASGVGDISTYVMTPVLDLRDGATFSFWTRTVSGSSRPDRLRVLMSTSGVSADVADFDVELATINGALSVGGYPEEWQEVVVTLSGVGAGTRGRIAFHYDVPNGGPNGLNSNFIGIDSVRYGDPLPPPLAEFEEGFENLPDSPFNNPLEPNLPPPGDLVALESGDWNALNIPGPSVNPSGLFRGSAAPILDLTAHSGSEFSFIGVDLNALTASAGQRSGSQHYLMTPVVELREGAVLSFWTREITLFGQIRFNRLRVVLSTSAESLDPIDFDTELVAINENLAEGGYPQDWTRFAVELSGMPQGARGRLALLHESNSFLTTIVYDTIRYGDPLVPGCQDLDVNQDGLFDAFDLLEILAAFDAGDLAVDFNGDVALTTQDIILAIEGIEAGCP